MKLAIGVTAIAAALWLIAGCVMAHAEQDYSPTDIGNCSDIQSQKLTADCRTRVAEMQAFYKQCESVKRTPAYTKCLYGTTEQDFLHSRDREAHIRDTPEYWEAKHKLGIPYDEDSGNICRHAEHIPECPKGLRCVAEATRIGEGNMSKLTAQEIDDRVTRVLASLHRSFDRGEINEAQLEQVTGDLARWSA
jgi:hypothetical protein